MAFQTLPFATETERGSVVFATATDTRNGTINTEAVHPLGLKTAQGFSNLYASAQTSFVAGTTYTFTHGLGAIPAFVEACLVCVTADRGFGVGEQVQLTADMANDSEGVTISRDATSVSVVVSNSALPLYVKRKDVTVGQLASLTLANWQLLVRAWG